ncbi:hypothetical protein BKA70DRAFT_1371189 [Coprinopsis sp. MPI-PUGE-AT-0042]|nr:hypothetical protein BKA70DRAFT_1371189 [Coprinopsis sp. MPI-PUGE-AT-0042]
MSGTSTPAPNALQRGKACLRCRSKCDGVKPACQQCTRAKKGDCCEYDDGKGKTRTQILKETIANLEQRVKELESPSGLPAASIFRSLASGSPSSFDSPDSSYMSAFPHESSASPSGSWSQLQPSHSPLNGSLMPDIFFDERQSPFSPSEDLAMILLDIFAPHSRQAGLEIDTDSLRSSLRSGSEHYHPALMNAVYLWACFVSRPEPLSQQEEFYLQRSLEAIPDALRVGQSLDVIRAYHASAAAALAEQIGLGKQADCMESEGKSHERILTFWQVYNVDKTWSVVLQKKALISDGPESKSTIICPWPEDDAEYKMNATIRSFLAGSMSAEGFSTAALRAKASALFSEADRLGSQHQPGMKIPSYLIDGINNLERIIAIFLSTVHQEKHHAIVAHTMAHAALMRLHRPFIAENPVSVEKCEQAARACISLISFIHDRDFVYLDPIIGPCWSWVADNTMARLDALQRAWPMSDASDLIGELTILYFAMSKFKAHFPAIAPALSRVGKRLA